MLKNKKQRQQKFKNLMKIPDVNWCRNARDFSVGRDFSFRVKFLQNLRNQKIFAAARRTSHEQRLRKVEALGHVEVGEDLKENLVESILLFNANIVYLMKIKGRVKLSKFEFCNNIYSKKYAMRYKRGPCLPAEKFLKIWA